MKLKAKYLFILLLYCLFIIPASAADIINNSYLKIFSEGAVTNGYPLEAESSYAYWRDLIPDDPQYEDSSSTYSLVLPTYNPSIFSERKLDEKHVSEMASISEGNYSSAYSSTLRGDLQSNSEFLKALIDERPTELHLFGYISDLDHYNANAAYYYEREPSSLRLAEESWLESDNQINFGNLIDHQDRNWQDEQMETAGTQDKTALKAYSSSSASGSNGWVAYLKSLSDNDQDGRKAKIIDPYDSNRFFAEQYRYIEEDSVEGAKSAENPEIAATNLKKFINKQSVAVNESHPLQNSSPLQYKWSRKKMNYAIIVGIDEYDDKSGLHSCVNDARSVADLMNDLGYRVILLSDSSERKPTKGNILDASVKDMILKNDMGNIIFYFSGHGIKDDNNTFYLIPQDANGDRATYISEYEFKKYISDLHNLAVILDVCNGAGMEDSVSSGQLMIASSQEDEPSNEEWTGSLSVFTQNLIDAIQTEKRRSNRILLQNCFYRAYNDTVHWSEDHFISQTPVIIDRTGGTYYLK